MKTLILAILSKFCLFSFWFCLGIYSLYIIPENSYILMKINKLKNFELFLLLSLIFIFFFLIEILIKESVVISQIFNIDYQILDGSSPQPGQESVGSSTAAAPAAPAAPEISTQNINPGTAAESVNPSRALSTCYLLTKGGDALLMSTAVSAAMKIYQKNPSLARKICTAVGGIGLLANSIIKKYIDGDIDLSTGEQKSFPALPSTQNELIERLKQDMFHLSGKDGLDLLYMIQYLQVLNIVIILIISYNLFLLYIDEDKLEILLLKRFPSYTHKIVKLYINSLKIFKKYGIVIIFCLFILLFVSNLYSYQYLNLFISNLYKIIEFYLKK